MELDNWKCDVQDSGLPPNSVPLYMTLTLRFKTLMPGLPFRPGFPHFILWNACAPPQGERWWGVCSLGVHTLWCSACAVCSSENADVTGAGGTVMLFMLSVRSQQYFFLGTFFPLPDGLIK